MDIAQLVILGLIAGGLTTWVGLGGGIFMTLVMAVLYGPQTALAAAAPALWIGNFHRMALYRRHLVWPAVRWIGSTALIGAIIGGFVATALPARVLQLLVVAATVGALIPTRTSAPTSGRLWSLPLGLLTGFTTATSGAGGIFLTPALLALGAHGRAFVSTGALISLLMHTGRLSAYAAGGWVSIKVLQMSAVLAIAIIAGNFVGRLLRERTSERVLTVALRGMMVVLAAIAVTALA